MGSTGCPYPVAEVVAQAATILAGDGFDVVMVSDSFSDGCPMLVASNGEEAVLAPVRISSGPRFCRGTVNALNRPIWRRCAELFLREEGLGHTRVSFANMSARRLSGGDYALRRTWA